MICDHTEAFSENGVPLDHNCTYVDAVNRLIPQAEKWTNTLCGPKPGNKRAITQWRQDWDRLFCGRMDYLVYELLGVKRWV